MIRGDLHEEVISCQVQVHLTLREEWEPRTAAAIGYFSAVSGGEETGIGSANHSVKNCSSWQWNTHRASLFIFLWPQASGPLFHPNCFASSCCHFPGPAANELCWWETQLWADRLPRSIPVMGTG